MARPQWTSDRRDLSCSTFQKATSLEASVPFLEKLTDVEQTLATNKFAGEAVALRSHIVAFSNVSNVSPPKGLLHRGIWKLEMNNIDDEPDWTFPGRPRDALQQIQAKVAASSARPFPEDVARAIPGRAAGCVVC